MSDWETTTLDQVGRIVTGKTPPTGDPSNYGAEIPFVTPTDMDGRRVIDRTIRCLSEIGARRVRSSFLPQPAVLVSCIGSDMGKAVITDRPSVTNQQINSIVVSDDFEMLFVYYNLLMRRDEIRNRAGGAAQPILNKTDFGRLLITFPPLEEQRAIASILGTLDDKIDLNRSMNKTLEVMARAIFKDWFVDFGPTRAKMESRPPYLVPEIWAMFPDRLDDEGKPEGWKLGSLDIVANVTMGASPDGNTYNDRGEGIPLVNGPVEYGDFFLRRIKWTTAPNKMSRRGDLILCVRGSTTGRHAFADGDYCLGRGVCSIRGIGDVQEFVDGCVLVHLDRLLQKTTGSVFPNLSSEDIRKFDVLIPADDIRKAYCEIVRPFRDQVWANVVQSETLTSTRDLLLPRLMSGEIQLRDAEKALEAVA
jgi:type I restriction enzyme S subunit